jgi:hypothetical protein
MVGPELGALRATPPNLVCDGVVLGRVVSIRHLGDQEAHMPKEEILR